MNSKRLFGSCLLEIVSMVPPSIHAENPQQVGADIIRQFAGQLKPRLKGALMDGGPVLAIEVCSIEAPKIASALSRQTGWHVRRVSAKARNLKTAAPDDWEQAVLERFEVEKRDGAAVSGLVYAEQIGGRFRMMKAQPVEPLCLTCHGDAIASEVLAAIKERYPLDMATGYSLGDIRGAFSLTFPGPDSAAAASPGVGLSGD